MTNDKALELQKQWGDEPCDHPDIIAEVDSSDDKWLCVQCGRVVDYDEWRRSQNKRP